MQHGGRRRRALRAAGLSDMWDPGPGPDAWDEDLVFPDSDNTEADPPEDGPDLSSKISRDQASVKFGVLLREQNDKYFAWLAKREATAAKSNAAWLAKRQATAAKAKLILKPKTWTMVNKYWEP
eukprot:11233418-Heterocapsa_arctica.AAC.1